MDAVAKAEDRDKVKVKASVLLRPHQLAPNAHRATPTLASPRMAQAQRTTAHPARKALVVTALSAARVTLPLKGCRVMTSSINLLLITKKTISNPVPMPIWVPKAGSMPLAISLVAAQAVNPTPP